MIPKTIMPEEQDRFIQRVERAVFDLRCGLPIVIHGSAGPRLMAPIEGITPTLFDEMQDGARAGVRLLLTGHRLAHLSLEQPADAAGLALQPGDTRPEVMRWAADPQADWPAGRPVSPAGEAERAALVLLRRAQLIPAAVCATPGAGFTRLIDERLENGELLAVSAADVFAHCRGEPRLQWSSEARMPLEDAPDSRFVLFREHGVMHEHLAVLIGDQSRWGQKVSVRLHSACLTGDLFASLRCDCGPQLRASVAEIAKRGGGILLYLAQEGRSIGLVNKIRTCQIQDDGLDTFDANHALGFDKDERDFAVAREMLAQLGVTRIELLTNNPDKLAAMNREPIRVAGRSSVYGRVTAENRRYLTAKARRAGHWLDALLGEPFDAGRDDLTGSG
jgi:GTP cyclohydrolase II